MPPRRPRRPLGPRRPGGPRRPLRPFGPRPPRRPRQLNPRLQRQLRRANHLMNTGDHANAAEIFINLGGHARDLGILGPAPMLFMRAAHALLLGALIERSLEQARTSMEMLAEGERWPALQRESQRYLEILEAEGYNEEAAELRQWMQSKFGEQLNEAVPAASDARLPEKCPYCGASMSLEQINAGGAQAAECQYCGSVVLPRGED